jgi:cell division protease FtsH
VDLEVIARGTPGFAGADLENLVNEAALLAARLDKKRVEMDDFESAKDKVLMGTERRSIVISDDEKKNTAYHEAGHTLVAYHLPGADPVHKVTIIPRGRAMGLTQQLPSEDRYSYDDEYVKHRIAILMGGRVAEEIKFGRKTTGAGNDIEQATDLARKMVCEWGMSSMGTIAYGKGSENPFLGRDINSSSSTYSDSTGELLDREVRRLVTEGYKTARDLLEGNIEQLEALSLALLDFETLDGEEINVAIEGGDVGEHRTHKEAEMEAAIAGGERARRAAAEEADRTPSVQGGTDTADGMA